MKEKIVSKWQALNIQQKSSFFTKLIFFLFLLVILFDIWVVRFSLFDFNKILEENLESGTLLQCIQEETQIFAEYTKNRNRKTEKQLKSAMGSTLKAVQALPCDYENIGERRYNKTWAIQNFYEVYREKRDELGELVHAFNKMKYATGEYIQALEEKRKTLDLLHQEELERLNLEKHLEITRLELLKNQINPHFLFNTLNVIGGMANLEEAFTTEKMIGALSSIFRYNLKTTAPQVSLSQEIKVVEDYMYLQEMRFGSRISYDISCGVDAERVRVPVYTFQPLVENAIIHGLSLKEEGGRIRIRIRERGKTVFIAIGDTGVGMEEGELAILVSKLKSGENKGIGLGNIYRRILSMYPGGAFGVFSKKGSGTVIRIEIPGGGNGTGGEGDVSDSGGRR